MYVRRRYRHRSITPMYYSRNPREVLHPYTGSSKITIESKDLEKVSEYLKSNGYTVVPPWGPNPPPVLPPIISSFIHITLFKTIGSNETTGLPTFPPPPYPYSATRQFRAGPYKFTHVENYVYIIIDDTNPDYYSIRIHSFLGELVTLPPDPINGQYGTSFYFGKPSAREYQYIVLFDTNNPVLYLPLNDSEQRTSSSINDPDIYYLFPRSVYFFDFPSLINSSD